MLDGLRCQWNRCVINLRKKKDITIVSELTDQFAAGRTTFVNTLCGKQVLEGKDADDAANAHIEEGVRIKPVTVGMAFQDEARQSSG